MTLALSDVYYGDWNAEHLLENLELARSCQCSNDQSSQFAMHFYSL